jgi:hypothetical protein
VRDHSSFVASTSLGRRGLLQHRLPDQAAPTPLVDQEECSVAEQPTQVKAI